jgi:hypothetical protein
MTLGDKCIQLYPNKIPIIVHYDYIPNKITKFLVDNTTTISYILVQIRRKIKISYTDSIYVLVNNMRPNDPQMVITLYQKYKNIKDGCLHVTIYKENIFQN